MDGDSEEGHVCSLGEGEQLGQLFVGGDVDLVVFIVEIGDVDRCRDGEECTQVV